jgi:hypothetical protein
MDGACDTHGSIENTYKISIKQTEGTIPLGGLRRRGESSSGIDHRRYCIGVAWCGLLSCGSR